MQRKYMRFDEYTISYLESGKGDPIVFLHAFPFNALMWNDQLQLLEKHFHVIAPDFPSFGSSSPTPPLLSMEFAAQITQELLDHLDIKQTVLAGLSMGGYIALACIELMPQRITTLLLADTHAREDTPEKKQQRQAMVSELQQQGPNPFIERFPSIILGETTLQQRQHVINHVYTLMKMASVDAIISAVNGMTMRPNRLSTLQQFKKPVHLLVGEEDTLTPLADAHEIAHVTPNATIHTIPQAGHLSNLEQPELFSQIILNIFNVK